MIRVTLTRDRKGLPRRLTVRGHAGQGRYGEDIVCAAASALVETLAIGLKQVASQPADGLVEEGQAEFTFLSPLSSEAQAIIETISAGLKDLAESEPRFVTWQQVSPE